MEINQMNVNRRQALKRISAGLMASHVGIERAAGQGSQSAATDPRLAAATNPPRLNREGADQVVANADGAVTTPMPPGPIEPTWESLERHYRIPQWFGDLKFAVTMHWGLYSVAAHGNEWYEKHMYASFSDWHVQHFGPQEKFGYKDLIPLFKAENWNPDSWAELFAKSGAGLVAMTAQHHDNFALWDSKIARWNAKVMGPHRDLVGGLAAAVRKRGLRFGLTNHGIENFTFITPTPEIAARLASANADLFDPSWEDFYHVGNRSDPAMKVFLTDWVNRNLEIIDKYQPDMLYFDNGVNSRVLDPLKLHVAAYYYNRMGQWGKEVSLITKSSAYSPSGDQNKQIGSILDLEAFIRLPRTILQHPWIMDDNIGVQSWGYIDGLTVRGFDIILPRLLDVISKNGVYMLNISPKGDGTIPQDQATVLLKIGDWLRINHEAIYGTHPWERIADGGTAVGALRCYYTRRENTLFAITSEWPKDELEITSLAEGRVSGKVMSIRILGRPEFLTFTQDSKSLRIGLPEKKSDSTACSFKIDGLILD
jgi:alpha-L-fucosidase